VEDADKNLDGILPRRTILEDQVYGLRFDWLSRSVLSLHERVTRLQITESNKTVHHNLQGILLKIVTPLKPLKELRIR
jgi:hypothetical protein